jgi:hypothetical protein
MPSRYYSRGRNVRCASCHRDETTVFYHCSHCRKGRLDICRSCYNGGVTCHQIMSMQNSTSSSRIPSFSSPSFNPLPPGPLSRTGYNRTQNKDMAMLQNWLQSTSVTEKPNVKWEDIAGLEGAKEEVLKDFESSLSEEDLQKGNEWADEVGSERLSSWANGLT